ncbi:MAG TPA: sulfatase-like hydrolase/transferase [Acholeplasma sp.]|nr:sulfatase-like hydrolase/transferase [Acholeplasma sp.]
MKNAHKHLFAFLILFYLLNIINTHFVTTELLNQHITVFPRNFLGEINAFLGNFAALTLIVMAGFLFIKRVNMRILYLIIVTLLLNIVVFGSAIFTKYYQTVFSLREMTLFKNPAVDLGLTIFVESVKDLIMNYRIVIFIPFIVMVIYAFIVRHYYKKDGLDFGEKGVMFKSNLLNGTILAGAVTVGLLTLSLFNISLKSKWPIFAERPLYGVQKAGLYNYYLGQACGFNFGDNVIMEVDIRTYKDYNKNESLYENIFGEKFSNILYKEDAEIDFTINPMMDKESLNGIFKNKNLVLIHLESFNHFLLNEDGPYLDDTYLSTFKKLLKESYVIENFYTNIGLGKSSDAEFAVLTGAHPLGDSTTYWNYNKTPYVFADLATLFNDRYSVAFHGDVRLFYNREKVYDKMYGFDNFHYFDPTEPYFEETQNGFWLFPDHVHTNLPNKVWLTENDLLEWLKIAYISTSENKGEKGFYYPILMNPHTPFLYNPTKEENLRFKKGDIDISEETRRYLNYETYMESFFNKFIEISYELKDTVYIFYGDHGSGIPEKDYYAIMGLSANSNNAAKLHFEYQQEMLKTIAFIYVPDDDAESLDIKPGLFKGVQKRVRSQVDIYRTIIELFDLQTNNYYFGVNLLSKEHTFAIDTKHFNIITDDYFIIGKKMIKDINYKDAYRVLSDDPKKDVVELYKYVLRFKNKLDHAIKENAYQYLKND